MKRYTVRPYDDYKSWETMILLKKQNPQEVNLQ